MKKGISVICLIAILLTVPFSLTACGSTIQEDWSTIILGEHLPTPEQGKLNDGSNLDDMFMGSVDNVKNDYYLAYKNACIDMGYTIESKETGSSYDAFNDKGYELSLSYYSDKIHITLKAPVELTEIEWPTTGIGAKLPIPASTVGKITSDSSSCFRITIGNTSIDGFADYVKECENNGFNVDYSKADERYEAKDVNGYRLYVQYVGFNQIEITIQTPKQESNTTSTVETTPTTAPIDTTAPAESTSSVSNSTGSLRTEFKDAMDSYEQFMDEYVAFMKKYSENPADLSLLSDYTTYMSKYAEFVKDFEKWENQEMNAIETAYYIDVQARVAKKLLEATQ